MNDFEIVSTEAKMQSPDELAKMIVQLSENIDSCKNDLSQIKNRGWFKRLTSNNTKDVAEIQIKQNDSMGTFLQITRMLIGLNFNNVVFLGALYEQICTHEKSRGKFCSNYLNIAKEFISATLTHTQKHLKRMDDLEELALSLAQKYNKKEQIDQEQDRRLKEIDNSLSQKEALDDKQSREIKKIVLYLRKKDEVDHKQTGDIIDLKKRIAELETLAGSKKHHITMVIYVAMGLSLTAIILSVFVMLQ